jgi:hypothetical protein
VNAAVILILMGIPENSRNFPCRKEKNGTVVTHFPKKLFDKDPGFWFRLCRFQVNFQHPVLERGFGAGPGHRPGKRDDPLQGAEISLPRGRTMKIYRMCKILKKSLGTTKK